jgi:hypothetical protein
LGVDDTVAPDQNQKLSDETARLEVMDTAMQDLIFEVHTTAH